MWPIQGYVDYADDDRDMKWPERLSMPPGPEQFPWTVEKSFIRAIPTYISHLMGDFDSMFRIQTQYTDTEYQEAPK